MCGIVGFTGHRQAAPILLDRLAKLEYRGYDSAELRSATGRRMWRSSRRRDVSAFSQRRQMMEWRCMELAVSVIHAGRRTGAEELNAHPHCSDDRNVVGVHNGIIENYQELREKLQNKGYTFYSIRIQRLRSLIDYYYKKYSILRWMRSTTRWCGSAVPTRCSHVQELSGGDLRGEKGQPDDHRRGGR